MHPPLPNSQAKCLRIRMSRVQSIAGRHLIGVHIEIAGLDINRDNLADIARFYFGTNPGFVDFLSASGEFFLAVAWFTN